MGSERIVFFDLETGGLDPLRQPIIQFAAVAVDAEWNEVEALELKVAFDPATADPGALAVNSFDTEVWKREAVHVNAARDRVADLFRRNATMQKISAKGRPYSVARLAAHNASFDCGFLVQWFKQAAMFCPAACFEPLDTLSLARWASLGASPAPENHKLETVCRWLGIELDGAHDALADVRATVQVARVLTQRLGIGLGVFFPEVPRV